MTTQAAPSYDAELQRLTKAAESAQALAKQHELLLNAIRAALPPADLPLDRQVKALMEQLATVNHTLADMVNQYMSVREGYITHEFMSAQEDAIEYLENIGWLRAGELERYYWTDAATK